MQNSLESMPRNHVFTVWQWLEVELWFLLYSLWLWTWYMIWWRVWDDSVQKSWGSMLQNHMFLLQAVAMDMMIGNECGITKVQILRIHEDSKPHFCTMIVPRSSGCVIFEVCSSAMDISDLMMSLLWHNTKIHKIYDDPCFRTIFLCHGGAARQWSHDFFSSVILAMGTICGFMLSLRWLSTYVMRIHVLGLHFCAIALPWSNRCVVLGVLPID